MARKKRPEEPENHERWLVSYADFITLLFAFFVVMYAVSSVNEGKYRVLSNSLVNAFNPQASSPIQGPSGNIQGRSGALVERGAIMSSNLSPQNSLDRKSAEVKMRHIATDILQVMGPLIKEGQVRVSQTARGVAVEINASVLFSSGQAVLQPESVKALVAVGQVLSKVDNLAQVEGYTDNAPIKSSQFPSNWELSAARAASVVRLFVENGVAPERLTVLGYGEFRPLADNATPEGMARNRRVNVMILSDNKDVVTPLNDSPTGTDSSASAATPLKANAPRAAAGAQ